MHDPVWLASYPRSGNTYFRILVKHYYDLDTGSVHNDSGFNKGPMQRIVGHLSKGGCLMKTHIKEHDTRQAIYLVRDGRQAVLSYWHHLRNRSYNRSLHDVMRGKTQFGMWSDHVNHWTRRVPEPTVVKFEDIVGGMEEEHLRSILWSVGLQVEPITDAPPPAFNDLHKMRPGFFRLGRVDEWKEVFGAEDLALFYKLHGGTLSSLGYVI